MASKCCHSVAGLLHGVNASRCHLDGRTVVGLWDECLGIFTMQMVHKVNNRRMHATLAAMLQGWRYLPMARQHFRHLTVSIGQDVCGRQFVIIYVSHATFSGPT